MDRVSPSWYVFRWLVRWIFDGLGVGASWDVIVPNVLGCEGHIRDTKFVPIPISPPSFPFLLYPVQFRSARNAGSIAENQNPNSVRFLKRKSENTPPDAKSPNWQIVMHQNQGYFVGLWSSAMPRYRGVLCSGSTLMLPHIIPFQSLFLPSENGRPKPMKPNTQKD